MMSAIHIALITDDAYALPAAVAIRLLRESKSPESRYRVHVVCDHVGEAGRALVAAQASEGCEVDLLVDPPFAAARSPGMKIDGLHVTTSALLKFALPDLFPSLDRLLYLDTDVFALKDVTPLWETDLGDSYLGAVVDGAVSAPVSYRLHNREIGLAEDARYFNSGVMLLDLGLMRRDKITERLLKHRLTGPERYMDQDSFNVVARDRVCFLPLRFNQMTAVCGRMAIEDIHRHYPETSAAQSRKDILAEAVLVHSPGAIKPWIYRNAPYAEEWAEAAERVTGRRYAPRFLMSARDKSIRFPFDGRQISASLLGIDRRVVASVFVAAGREDEALPSIRAVLGQSVAPDLVVAWVSAGAASGVREGLPGELISLADEGRLQIRPCDCPPGDVRAPLAALRAFPEDVVVTFGLAAPPHKFALEALLLASRVYPGAVAATDGALIPFDKNYNKVLEGEDGWKAGACVYGVVSQAMTAFTGGAVLFPPSPRFAASLGAPAPAAPSDLDSWLKFAQLKEGVPVVRVGRLHGWKDDAVAPAPGCFRNLAGLLAAGSDGEALLPGLFEAARVLADYVDLNATKVRVDKERYSFKRRFIDLGKALDDVKNSREFRVGTALTWLPKRLLRLLSKAR